MALGKLYSLIHFLSLDIDMIRPQPVFVMLLLTFILGTLSVQINHALEGSLHGNMKKYFYKKYFHMAGNSKEAGNKKFEASNIRKWIGERSLKRDVAGMLTKRHHQSLPVQIAVSNVLKPSLFNNQLLTPNFLQYQLQTVAPSFSVNTLSMLLGTDEKERDVSSQEGTVRQMKGKHSSKREMHHASKTEEIPLSSNLLTSNLFNNQLQTEKAALSKLLGTAGNQLASREMMHHPSEERTDINNLFDQQIQTLSLLHGTAQKERDVSNQEGTLRQLMKMIDSLTVGKSPAAGHQNVTRDNILEILEWFHEVSHLRKNISNDIDSYTESWKNALKLFPDRCDGTVSSQGVTLPLLGFTPDFMNLFWPFRFDINIMNQRLALFGLTKKLVTNSNETLKEEFFKEIQELQGLPVKGNQILFSFEDDDVIDGLNRSKVIAVSKSYFEAGKHLFTKEEQQKISSTANKALDMIEMTHPELYRAMVQLVSCIAFYKDEEAHYMGAASLGAIWLDPSRSREWTVPFMAEQIVHEFIHTSLQYAELVLGGYKNNTRLPEAKVMSAIRHELRDYDKSLHAAYVSAGLITFHTRAGFLDRAANLAETLPGAVEDLNRVNAESDVLDEAGRAMLHFLTDYVCLTRM